MRVDVLVVDNVSDLGLFAILDAFQAANELIFVAGLDVPRFEVRTVGVRKTVKSSQGLSVPVHAVGASVPDCVVVPAIRVKFCELREANGNGYAAVRCPSLEGALSRPDVRDACSVLRDWARRGSIITGACIGTFLIAESKLLNRQRATTPWWLAPFFRKRYPSVVLDESSMIVTSGPFVTAGAALSHMDLALWIIRNQSPKLASLTAKYLIADSRPSQSVYALSDHLVHTDPIVQSFETWARKHLEHGFSLDDAAKAVGASKRTLARRMQRVLGKSPLSYFQQLRLERAVHLLKTETSNVDEVAAKVG